MRAPLFLFLSLLAALRLVAAEVAAPKLDALVEPAPYAVPEKTDDGWETGSLASVGLNAGLIGDMCARIKDGTYKNIHGLVLVKNGRLVAEEYFTGRNGDGKEQVYARDTLHTQQSVTKSVNSILIGIAIDRHLIGGMDEKISTFFPELADLFADDAKKAIRLKDCLSMTAGLSWSESGIPYTDSRNDAFGLNRSQDPVRFVFERPVDGPAGQKFLYHSGISVALGGVVQHVSGLRLEDFAERHLFQPLGIASCHWGKLPNGAAHTGGGLWLRPRDMAKIGFLYLNGGRWQDTQIVSAEWVRASTRQQAPYRGYGYQWWLRSFRGRDRAIDAYAAQGLGGQFIFVFPDLQMVAVFTGWNLGPLIEQPADMLQRFILPAADPL